MLIHSVVYVIEQTQPTGLIALLSLNILGLFLLFLVFFGKILTLLDHNWTLAHRPFLAVNASKRLSSKERDSDQKKKKKRFVWSCIFVLHTSCAEWCNRNFPAHVSENNANTFKNTFQKTILIVFKFVRVIPIRNIRKNNIWWFWILFLHLRKVKAWFTFSLIKAMKV